MSEYINPIESLFEINDGECLAGYRAGFGFTHVDYTQKSASYWHGYQNAMADKGLEPVNPVSAKIAKEMISEGRARSMN